MSIVIFVQGTANTIIRIEQTEGSSLYNQLSCHCYPLMDENNTVSLKRKFRKRQKQNQPESGAWLCTKNKFILLIV